MYRQLYTIIYLHTYEYWYDIHLLQGLQDEPCLWHWKLPLEPVCRLGSWPSCPEVAKGSAEAIFDAQEFGDFLIYPQAGSFGIAKFMLQIDINKLVT